MKVISWNIGGGFIMDETVGRYSKFDFGYVFERLLSYSADIICLQEVQESSYSDLLLLSSTLNMQFIFQSISPSHFDPASKLGLVVFSKWPILRSFYLELPNPRITAIDDDGVDLISFDNGFVVADLGAEPTLTVLCGHNLPFHRFHRDFMEAEFKVIRSALAKISNDFAEKRTIICADMNFERIDILVPEFDLDHYTSCLPNVATTPKGRRLDFILSTRALNPVKSYVDNNALTDHFPCIAEVDFKNEEEIHLD